MSHHIQPNLPVRITRMIGVLHGRGYQSIYLYSGLSPSGGHWRYAIGPIIDGRWPKGPALVSSSIGKPAQLPWTHDASASTEVLADAFETFYGERLEPARTPNAAFANWYAMTLNALGDAEPLLFFADYGAPHETLLDTAPGYARRGPVQ